MKRVLIFIAATCVLTSCYKNECHVCITQTTLNGITQTGGVERTYCGVTKKELKAKETSTSRYFQDSTGRNMYEYIATHCDPE